MPELDDLVKVREGALWLKGTVVGVGSGIITIKLRRTPRGSSPKTQRWIKDEGRTWKYDMAA